MVILATSQVCGRWRQITLSSKSLWSEIKHTLSRKISPLGEIFASRSGDLPVNIRVIEPYTRWHHDYSRRSISRFFAEVGPRVASFELAMLPPLGTRPQWPLTYFYILASCFKRCVPGQLTRVTLSDRNISSDRRLGGEYFESSAHCFFFPRMAIPQGFDHRSRAIRLDDTLLHFEDVFTHVKVLGLDSIYPFWTSKAYHGLTELRLTGPRQLTTVITIQELADILGSSPALRFLHFGLEVSPAEAEPYPVHLRDLEVFILHSLHHDTQQAVLKLIAPGLKPLQMSTMYNKSQLQRLPASFHDEFYQFFRRSNISYLEVFGMILPVELPKLLELLPNLQTLIFRQVTFEKIELFNRESAVAPTCPQLRSLHLRCCTFDLEALRWMVNTYDLQEVTLYHSEISPNPPGRETEFLPLLLNICPFVQFLDHDSAIGIGDRVLALSDIYSRDTSAYVTDYMLH
ncbi:hypothetical protein RSAG8_10282, partial [Rhizoctonia solani AG-8 WAC10335]